MREALRTAAGHALIACLAALAISLSVALPAAAENVDSRGTDFWLAFPRNLSSPTLNLFITGATATSGTVTVPGLTPIAFSVTPGVVTTVAITPNAQLLSTDGTENKGIHVTAVNEVTVYGFSRTSNSTETYLGLPTDVLGDDYIILSYPNHSSGLGTGLAVVATEDSTTITITPSISTGTHSAGVPYSLSLNQGQAYQLMDMASASADLSGTIVKATRPVAVFGVHRCATVPSAFSACNHLVEQLPPTSVWGTNFATMPLGSRLNGDTFRLIASQDGTTVWINDGAGIPLDRGDVHEAPIEPPAHITSDHPILVAQYSNSQAFDSTASDAFMVLIPPTEQFLASYRVVSPNPAVAFDRHFINVVVPDAALGSVKLDDVALPASAFTSIGTSGFSGVQQSVAHGHHTLSGPLAFGVSVYGFRNLDAYGYPGGVSIDPVARVDTITLAPDTALQRVDAEHCVVATVFYEDGGYIEGVWVKFALTGAHSADDSVMTDANGASMFCYTGTQTGEDTIVASVASVASNQATVTWFDNEPPDVSAAAPTVACLWPANHVFGSVGIVGVTDPDNDPLTIAITGITSDEATATVAGAGGEHFAPDAEGVGTDTASVRVERSGPGDGRVYRIWFDASDGQETVSGWVAVGVAHDQNSGACAVDSGQNYDATVFN